MIFYLRVTIFDKLSVSLQFLWIPKFQAFSSFNDVTVSLYVICHTSEQLEQRLFISCFIIFRTSNSFAELIEVNPDQIKQFNGMVLLPFFITNRIRVHHRKEIVPDTISNIF